MLDFCDTARYTKQVVRRRQIMKYGGIAQLGERLNGIQEVSGSIPLISTNKKPWKPCVSKAFLFLRY